jgi:hypothetical protein
VSSLLPLAVDRETLLISALIALGVAGLVVAWGALVLLGRERRSGHHGDRSRPDEERDPLADQERDPLADER